jgi:hypothetical protein
MEEAIFAIGRLLEEFGDSIGEDLRRMQCGELDLLADRTVPDCVQPQQPREQLCDVGGSNGSRRPAVAHREIVLEARADGYVTVDELISGRRVFSQRMRSGQIRTVQRDGPVCVSASNGDALSVCGKTVEKFNCGEL